MTLPVTDWPNCSVPLLVLGCGFVGRTAAEHAVRGGRYVVATTRSESHAAALRASGIDARVAPHLDRHLVRSLLPEGAQVLIGFPPDGSSDAEVASALAASSSLVYLSTTGVYGRRMGRVDELTPVDRDDENVLVRLAAEASYLAVGGTVLRAAGIYGRGRGLHVRLQDPTYVIPRDAANVVCRVHVEDLARLALLSLCRKPRSGGTQSVLLVADDTPVPQIEVIRWLCDRLCFPMPPFESVDVSAAEDGATERRRRGRRNRVVDNTRVKSELRTGFSYPSYKEGFAACLEPEKAL